MVYAACIQLSPHQRSVLIISGSIQDCHFLLSIPIVVFVSSFFARVCCLHPISSSNTHTHIHLHLHLHHSTTPPTPIYLSALSDTHPPLFLFCHFNCYHHARIHTYLNLITSPPPSIATDSRPQVEAYFNKLYRPVSNSSFLGPFVIVTVIRRHCRH
jgi:hypothetical protein